jgi:ADP-heptose:LPS heptosyltransferase
LARSYDTVLDLHASFRSGLIGLTASGGQRTGFKDARELNTLFQHRVVAVPKNVEHALEKNLLFVRHLGLSTKSDDFQIYCSQDDQDCIIDFLDSRGITEQQQIIYANPAARWQSKFWPKKQWAELADQLYESGKIMVFAGSRHDCGFVSSVTDLMQSPPVVAAGRFTLPQTVALLKRSSLYVGLDSGPMHMAAIASVPVVALFGPTHPARVGPYNVNHKIVRADHLDCLECRKRSCDHLSCMKDISVAMVYEAVFSLLAGESN